MPRQCGGKQPLLGGEESSGSGSNRILVNALPMAVCLLAPPFALSWLATRIAGVGTNPQRGAHRRLEGRALTAIATMRHQGKWACQAANPPVRPLFHVKQLVPYRCP